MRKRIFAGAIALLLAAAGTTLVLSYIRGADARALSGLDTVVVLVADAPIAAGTTGADLTKLVVSKELPANAVLPGRVTDLNELAGEHALVALEPGEQLLSNKFGAPVHAGSDELVIPPEFQQVTILLELKQAMGGEVKTGDRVGVFLSYTDANGHSNSHLAAQKVLVTRVARASSTAAAAPTTAPAAASAGPTDTGSAESATEAPPQANLTESLLVTVATTAAMAEKIVFAAEFGSIWLSQEPATAAEGPTQLVDGILVFQ